MKCGFVFVAAAMLSCASVEARQKSMLQALGTTTAAVQDLKLPGTGRAAFDVGVMLDGRHLTLELSPSSVRGPNFQVLVQGDDGVLRPFAAPPETTYRGSVRGEPGSVVAASLTNHGLTGLVRLNVAGGTQAYSIQPLAEFVPGSPASAHVITSERDVIRGPWRCGVEDHVPARGPGGGGGTGGGVTDAFLACQISVDADNEFYILNGSSVPNTTADITSIVNGMAAIYQSDANVTFQLGTVVVRQSGTQPYTATDSGALLTTFRNEWNANQTGVVRDIAHLFTGKDLDGSTIGLAYVGVVCTTVNAYGLSQSRFTANFASRVGVSCHEVGHNFNLDHCDATCSPCRIMCSGIGGCSGVVTSFGCSAPALASYATGRACLTPLNNGLTPPFLDTFSTLVIDYTRWPNPTNTGAVASAAGVGERSAPNSLNLSNAVAITSAGIDLTNTGGHRVFVTFWSEHRGVETGKTLAVAYRRPIQGDFLPLTTLTSDGVNQNLFVLSDLVLPTDGHGANAALRFTAAGNQADDAWYIDDVSVSLYCRADLNQDWALNILDFQTYQAGLATLNVQMCDWNGDGFITVLDYSAFFNAVAAGCTGY